MAPAQEVKVATADLPEVLDRLQEKKQQVERELLKIPGAPSTRDVFQLCRGFERAFAYTIEKTDYAGLIRRAFQDEGLAGAVSKLPLERKFRLETVREVIRISDGYQPHLVSPEAGLRKLVRESIELVLDPVSTAVRRVHQVLLEVAREATRKASLLLDSTVIDETRTPLKLPQFEIAVSVAASKALECWRDEALEVARTIVYMEQGYVTAAFFRHRLYERYRQWEQERQLGRMLDEGHAVPDDSESDDDSDDSPSGTDSQTRRNLDTESMSSAGGMAIPDQEPQRETRQAERNREPEFGGDLKTGYMEKRIGENSSRQNLPESWKWQKRYFVLSEPKGLLYYFKSADDPPTYRGIINVRECKIEDVDANGLPKTASRSKYDLDGGGGTVSLLIKVSHKDPSRPAIKKHHSLVLRCESAAEKYAWLARLKYVSETPASERPVRKYSSKDFTEEGRQSAAEKDKRGEKRDGKPAKASQSLPSAPSTPHVQAAMGGIASTVLFQEDSKIGPEPMSYGLFDGDDARGFDGFLAQLGEDTAAYVRTVCNTIVLTVPKAIIHCQVKRAERHLLEELYDYMTNLSKLEQETLLDEEPDTMQRRAAIKQAIKDLGEGIASIKEAIEERSEAEHYVASSLLEMAGMTKLAPRHVREDSGTLYGDYTPAALKDAGQIAASKGPPARSASSSSSTMQPRRPSVSSASPSPRVQVPQTPSGPPNLSSPSPMPRRRPPAPPPADAPSR